ncbi:multidrug resistance-associated protein 1-like [Oppia nitens]|uniref:multidrug resistance-associated protein 1-like n=1 Tax=Oppia nitens TaxID=1686743 RepID=UPI0023DC9C13|nr:multidrug resistance-associated protein 1-like [Oppia nitens]
MMSVTGIITYRSLFLMTHTSEPYDGLVDDFRFGTKLAFIPIVFLQLLLSCITDFKSYSFKKSKNESPEPMAPVLSVLTFWWANALILIGYKRPLTKQDLWKLSHENITKHNSDLFTNNLKPNAKQLTGNTYNGILWALMKTYWFYMFLMSILKLALSFLPYVNPIILNWLISYMDKNNDEPVWRGYLYACLMFFSPMLESILTGQYELGVGIIILRMRSCLTNAIYKKSLQLSSTGRKDFTIGEIVNLMAIDTSRIIDFVQIINDTWSSPLQIAIAMYLLWQQLGVASLAGLGAMVLIMPINGYIIGKIRYVTSRLMKHKDKRIKLMNEILSGIKVLKLYAWESSFDEQVMTKRDHEIKQLTTRAYFQGAMVYIFNSAPFFVSITSFATYVLMDSSNILTPQKAFVSLSLFNQMRFPLNLFPRLISFYAMFSVSIKRINKYMSGDEIDSQSITHAKDSDNAIVVDKASFSWTKTDAQSLTDISLTVPKNKLIAIVGQVGSGKSSLLHAMLGDMFKQKGQININGSIAYVPQQAWIQNASLQQNIIYTNPMDEKKLNTIIENCALVQDIQILPGGQTTEIGEKGINLSGGQKQRVSMARACYSSADIYLLDDPLSALDANVGKHIFDKVIGPNGMLKTKTRVLVTHKISVLSKCDQILVMKDGFISESGTYRQLLENRGDFADFLLTHINETDDEDMDEEELQMIDTYVRADSLVEGRQRSQTKLSESGSQTSSQIRRRTLSNTSKAANKQEDNNNKKKDNNNKKIGRLIESEKSETGSVKWTVYLEYFRRVGYIGSIAVLLSYVGSSAFNIAASQWLSMWSDDSEDPELVDDIRWRNIRLGVYAVFGSGEAIFLLISTIMLNLATLKGARILHNDMLHHIFRAPMSFFDTTPMGRILNRFSRDVDVCDTLLNMNIRMTMVQAFRAISAFAVMAIETPLILAFLLPIGLVYLFVQRLYIPTSRQLRRIESTTRSPIYIHFSETLTGATSIRAYGSVDKFVDESNKRVDMNNMSTFAATITSCWLSIRLELLGYTIIFINALYAVIARRTLSPGVAGLTLSYAMTITRTLNNLIRATTQLETNIVSVERCLEYTETPQEALWHKPECQPPSEWPEKGCIKFQNYSTRYRDGLDLVLREISFTINPGYRVGVVGRTGAGKSSLTLALFRIIESTNGSIDIDGVDTGTIGLYDLRSRLTIIPQDPVLFTGTLRLNLDPFEKHSDSQLWTALELAHLKTFVQSLDNGLSHEVIEGGDNLSVGQKQLICLARALLRKSKIIVLDEATAAVDIETDELIQKTIRTEFGDCTIVTIAHRLNTILDYDRVLVMDRGTVAEYDSPQVLLNDNRSIFYSMAKDSGHA